MKVVEKLVLILFFSEDEGPLLKVFRFDTFIAL